MSNGDELSVYRSCGRGHPMRRSGLWTMRESESGKAPVLSSDWGTAVRSSRLGVAHIKRTRHSYDSQKRMLDRWDRDRLLDPTHHLRPGHGYTHPHLQLFSSPAQLKQAANPTNSTTSSAMSSSNSIVDLATETKATMAIESVPSTGSQPEEVLTSQEQKQKQKPRFRCPELGCTRTFNRKYTLSEHSKTHTGEKPHVCPVRTCGKRFTTSGNLSRHKRLHGPMMPIACPVIGCECAFSSDSKLEKHMTFHFGTAEHACVVSGCGKTFSTFGNHNRHMRNQHTREERLLAMGRSVGSVDTTSPSGSDEWSQSCASNSEDDDEAHYEQNSPWAAANANAAAGLPTTEPLYNYEPREPWNPEMLEALSLILEEKMVIPNNSLSR